MSPRYIQTAKRILERASEETERRKRGELPDQALATALQIEGLPRGYAEVVERIERGEITVSEASGLLMRAELRWRGLPPSRREREAVERAERARAAGLPPIERPRPVGPYTWAPPPGLPQAELEVLREELLRLGRWYSDLVPRLAEAGYGLRVQRMAEQAASWSQRLWDRLGYDRAPLEQGFHLVRELLAQGPVRQRDIERECRKHQMSRGLQRHVAKLLGVIRYRDPATGRVMWRLEREADR